MASPLDIMGMTVRQMVARQSLERRPEPTQLTEADDHVVAYDQVMLTKLVIAYAVGLEVIHKAAEQPMPTSGRDTAAADLACGPGHFTLALAQYLGLGRVTGMDLSGPMVTAARDNAARQQLSDSVLFGVGDATRIDGIADCSLDLVTCTDAAHHLPDLLAVRRVLEAMDRVAKPNGLVVMMDLARLRTASLTDHYVRALASDYAERGLTSFYTDFENSMYAAWTASELRQVAPEASSRQWVHLVPFGLPTMQFVVGLPVGRSDVFVRPGYGSNHPLINEWLPKWRESLGKRWARETATECWIARQSLRWPQMTRMQPQALAPVADASPSMTAASSAA